MPLHAIPEETLRTICRQRIESCELWMRRLAHDKFTEAFGAEYSESQWKSTNLLKKELRAKIQEFRVARPHSRPIDALDLPELSSLLCREDLYPVFFADTFGAEFKTLATLRLLLDRLNPIRNSLSHARSISVRDAEQAICYCADVTVPIKNYYRDSAMADSYPAPSFTRFVDSIGNERHELETRTHIQLTANPIYVGEHLRCSVEVDASFPEASYEVEWQVPGLAEKVAGVVLELQLGPKQVAKSLPIICLLKSKEDWHRHTYYDARLNITYQIRPTP